MSSKTKRKDDDDDDEMIDDDDDNKGDVQWNGDAYVTSANYHVKKMTFLLFINRAYHS